VSTVTSAADRDDARRLTAVYLNDHLAGSTLAIERAKHAARAHQGGELGAFLAGLAEEIEEDRRALRRVMAAAGARPQRTKVAAAWLAEKAGRVKPNGRLLRSSPLSTVVELEGLELGISGKLLLWQLYRDQRPPGAGAVDVDALIARAQDQIERVERHRSAAGAALRA
jgi:hypothetical protein